jgi:hypothetical protein
VKRGSSFEPFLNQDLLAHYHEELVKAADPDGAARLEELQALIEGYDTASNTLRTMLDEDIARTGPPAAPITAESVIAQNAGGN